MTNNSFKLDIIESPCVGQCSLNDDKICEGCYRSLDEIGQWTLVDGATRRQFMQNIEQRRKNAASTESS